MGDNQVPRQLRLPLFPSEEQEIQALVDAAILGFKLPPALRSQAIGMGKVGGKEWLVGWLAVLPLDWRGVLESVGKDSSHHGDG